MLPLPPQCGCLNSPLQGRASGRQHRGPLLYPSLSFPCRALLSLAHQAPRPSPKTLNLGCSLLPQLLAPDTGGHQCSGDWGWGGQLTLDN